MNPVFFGAPKAAPVLFGQQAAGNADFREEIKRLTLPEGLGFHDLRPDAFTVTDEAAETIQNEYLGQVKSTNPDTRRFVLQGFLRKIVAELSNGLHWKRYQAPVEITANWVRKALGNPRACYEEVVRLPDHLRQTKAV